MSLFNKLNKNAEQLKNTDKEISLTFNKFEEAVTREEKEIAAIEYNFLQHRKAMLKIEKHRLNNEVIKN